MTTILEVMANFCAVYVDDFRLQDCAAYNPPLYSHKMWGYLRAAIPFFTHPMDEQERLLGTDAAPKLTAPIFATTNYTVPQAKTQDFDVALGEQYKGFELHSAQLRQTNAQGEVLLTPLSHTYNAATGTVTISASATAPIAAGAEIDFDFYKDGFFAETLTEEEKKILGMCFDLVWETRFDQDYLSRVSKVEDKSFFEQNRANKQNSDTERHRAVLEELRQAMQALETRRYYKAAKV